MHCFSDRALLRAELAVLLENSRLAETCEFVQHGQTSTFLHSVAVAWYCLWLARLLRLEVDRRALVRGALLHDYFLYDWHQPGHGRLHGFCHPAAALDNARLCCRLDEREENIILRHMFPLTLIPPRCREGVLVCLVDKGCSLFETFNGRYRRLWWAQRMVRRTA